MADRKIEKITNLRPYPKNPREGDVGAIVTSLETLGQYRPIVVNKRPGVETTMTVLAGNHTLKAATALGWTEIAVTWVDVDDETAERIVLVDNRTNDLATYNSQLLADLLVELAETDTGLVGTGYDGDDLDKLLFDLGEGLTWGDAVDALGGGGTMQTMTFTIHNEDKPDVDAALDAMRDGYGEGPTENRNGQALVALARTVL